MLKRQYIVTLCHRIIVSLIGVMLTISCSQINGTDLATLTTLPPEDQRPATEFTSTIETVTETNQFESLCTNRENTVSDVSKIQGSFILSTPNGVVALDISSAKIKPVGINGNFTKTSFAGDAVVGYVNNNMTEIQLMTENEATKFSLPEESQLYGFLENGSLLFGANSNYKNNNETAIFYIITPTGEASSRSIDLVNFYEEDIAFTQNSPNFKYIMYPQRISGKSRTSILNIENGELTTLDNWIMASTKFGPFPIWTPNSSAITAVLVPQEDLNQARNYFNIFSDGHVTQLTYLEDIVNGDYELLNTPAWSPNNQYLVIPISINEENTKTLFVFDRLTETIVDICISWTQALYVPLAWSPNSKYLAVQADNGNKIIIFNIENEITYELVVKDISNFGLLSWIDWEEP